MVDSFLEQLKEERFEDLDNMLYWYGLQLHNIGGAFNIYDVGNNNYIHKWDSIIGCGEKILQLQAKYKEVNLKLKHYTACVVEFLDDKTTQEVIIKSNDEYIESEDDYIFYYGLNYNQLVNIYINNIDVDNEWRILAIISVKNLDVL